MSSIFLDSPDNKTVDSISDNAKCFYVISHILQNFSHLRELNISNNSIGGVVILQAIEGLLQSTKSLKILNVNNCQLGPNGGGYLARVLTTRKDLFAKDDTPLMKNPSRKQLQLWDLQCSRNRMGDMAMRDIAILIEEMGSIEKLDVSANNAKYGLRLVLKALFKSKMTLRDLQISCNKSVNKSIRPLEQLIRVCPNLETLEISDLNMKPKHQAVISDAILKKIKSP